MLALNRTGSLPQNAPRSSCNSAPRSGLISESANAYPARVKSLSIREFFASFLWVGSLHAGQIVAALRRHAARLIWLLLLIAVQTFAAEQLPPNSVDRQNPSKWESEIAAFEANDRTNPPPKNCIVFVGSSSIRLWSSLKQDFPDLPVVNRGFGGSELADSVKLANRIIIPYHPRQVVIYAGGNDLAGGKAPEVVYGDFVALVTTIRQTLSSARIAFIASAPNPKRWAIVDKIRKFNGLAQEYCREHDMTFVDVFPLMLGPNGLPKPDIFRDDGLHMNAKGYVIWRQALAPVLK